MINNACATQAIISVLLNVSHTDMDLGNVLTEFKEFSCPLDPAVSELDVKSKLDVVSTSCDVIINSVAYCMHSHVEDVCLYYHRIEDYRYQIQTKLERFTTASQGTVLVRWKQRVYSPLLSLSLSLS